MTFVSVNLTRIEGYPIGCPSRTGNLDPTDIISTIRANEGGGDTDTDARVIPRVIYMTRPRYNAARP